MNIKSKTRPDDRLSNLPPEDRARLDAWLKTHTYQNTRALAAQPRPDGLDLQTSNRALSVYYHKYLGPTPLTDLEAVIKAHPEAAEKAASAFILNKAIELASGRLNISAFAALARFHIQLNQQSLAERRLTLDQQSRESFTAALRQAK